jgi:hypothetical protein
VPDRDTYCVHYVGVYGGCESLIEVVGESVRDCFLAGDDESGLIIERGGDSSAIKRR